MNVNFRVLKSPLASQSEEDWLKLGLSEHICEIQLVPMEYFQRSKIGEAHKNYIRYRNQKKRKSFEPHMNRVTRSSIVHRAQRAVVLLHPRASLGVVPWHPNEEKT